ncbi:UDP-N-acetylmuramate dehydrogenase [Leucobacter chinensis]|uniref:UDP-N-acetylmuramate dehydrogenase n=1 Tax=Leucobacter chinensis TaxID=2851010 RepID=UPI001C22BEE8
MSESVASLASLTTMRVGGHADRVLVARSRDELIERSIELWADGDDWLLLGGGSNTIVSDEGYPGPVLLARSEGIEVIDDPSLPANKVRVRVQAGQDWDSVVVTTLARGWGGLEALSGIPGCAGAAPMQNIGAYGCEIADVLVSIELLERDTEEVRMVSAEELAFGYRDSALKRRDLEGVVLSIDLVLTRGADGSASSAPVIFPQLAKALDVKLGAIVSGRDVRESVLSLRGSKGMVLDSADHDTWSAGSFFTNPIVSADFAKSLPADAPRFPMEPAPERPIAVPLEDAANLEAYLPPQPADRRVKLSAAWLIEHAGIKPGYRIPGSGAGVSTKHSLAITNRGSATAAEVAELARYITTRVQSEFGVLLVPEPNIYGLQL